MEYAAIPAGRTETVKSDPEWQALYAEHFRGVWRNLRRLGVPPDLLDDAVQDVFLVVHRRADEFGGRSSLKTWIFGIVLRVAKDYRRAALRRERRVKQYASSSPPSERSSPADEVARREELALLHRILGELGEEERAVFVLVELEQLPVREAAQAASLSLSTCERRLRTARRQFDRALQRLSERRPIPCMT